MLLILRLVFLFFDKVVISSDLRKINYTRMEKSIINSVTLPRN